LKNILLKKLNSTKVKKIYIWVSLCYFQNHKKSHRKQMDQNNKILMDETENKRIEKKEKKKA